MRKNIVMESKREYCLMAEMIPKGMPRQIAMITEKAASLMSRETPR
jgi:hypothetical protein